MGNEVLVRDGEQGYWNINIANTEISGLIFDAWPEEHRRDHSYRAGYNFAIRSPDPRLDIIVYMTAMSRRLNGMGGLRAIYEAAYDASRMTYDEIMAEEALESLK